MNGEYKKEKDSGDTINGLYMNIVSTWQVKKTKKKTRTAAVEPDNTPGVSV